jgi:RimJ/RimL family protein N-acetyltransferase
MSTQTDITFSTTRLNAIKFDPENEDHCSFLVTLWNSPLFISSCGKTGITSLEKAKELIENRFVKEYARNGYGNYLLALKPTDGTRTSPLVGTVALTKGDSKDSFTVPDLGFAILPEFNGKGLASEAVKGVLKYGSKEFGVTDVFGFCDPANQASRKVLEKSGLEFRGVQKLACFGGVQGGVFALPYMDQSLEAYLGNGKTE